MRRATAVLVVAVACAPRASVVPSRETERSGLRSPLLDGTQWLDPGRRFDVPLGASPVRGPADAKVTIVDFNDLNCLWCAFSEANLEAVVAQHPNEGRVVWKHSPGSLGANALPVARAAVAAQKQGKFWALQHLLSVHFARLTWRPKFDEALLEPLVREAGLDPARWRADFDSPASEQAVREDVALAQRWGATVDPTLFINGVRITGVPKREELERLVDLEVLHADAMIARGVAPGAVYGELTRDAVDPSTPLPALGDCGASEVTEPLTFPGHAMVPLCRDVFIDPAVPESERGELVASYREARRYVEAVMPVLKPRAVKLVICRSDECAVYFAGPTKRSKLRGEGQALAGSGYVSQGGPTIVSVDSGPFVRYTLAHELVHLALGARINRQPVAAWFNDGLAVTLTGAPWCRGEPDGIDDLRRVGDNHAWEVYTDQLWAQRASYCQARAEVDAWVRLHGVDAFNQMLDQVRDGRPFDSAYGPLARSRTLW